MSYLKKIIPNVTYHLNVIQNFRFWNGMGIVKSSGLNARVTWKGGPNLRRKLVRSAFRPLPCPGGETLSLLRGWTGREVSLKKCCLPDGLYTMWEWSVI